MNAEPATLAVVTVSDDLSRGGKVERVTKALEIDDLRDRLNDFMSKLQSMVAIDTGDLPFALEEVQFTAEIAANGEFKLLGTGVGVEAASSVTFTLRHREAAG